MDLIKPGDVLGLTWSRTLSGLTAALTQLPPCPIVQMTGAVPPPDGRDLLELVRGVARIGGGPAHVFYAPMLLDDAQTAAAIRRQGDIAEAFALVPKVTIAVVAIGAWGPGLSTIYDAITPAEREALAALGVHAEVAGVFIGADGSPRVTPLDSRMIVTPGPLFTLVPFVLAVAYDPAKSSAVRAAIRGGLVHGLVTHTSLARALLYRLATPTEATLGPAGLRGTTPAPPISRGWRATALRRHRQPGPGRPRRRHGAEADRAVLARHARPARPSVRGRLRRRAPGPRGRSR